MNHRERTEIITFILKAANTEDGSSKAKIMYESFVSFSQLNEYLSLLLRNGLLECDRLKKTYKTNEKGLHLIALYNKLNDMIHTSETQSWSS